MKTDYEYIVVGLGGLGSAAAYWLSRRAGGQVLGLEQFEVGHLHGASHDHSRIIRLSYHTPAYVRLAQEAFGAWAALESEAGEKLILKTGGLDFAPRVSAIPLSTYMDSLTTCGVPFELLEAAEIMRRWPPFRLPDDVHGLYQPDGGIAPAIKCNAAHLRLAQARGAAVRERTRVTALRDLGSEVEVGTEAATFRCRKLILTVDAWSNQMLAHFGLSLPLTITQEQVTYFATPHLADFQPNRFPIWIWMDVPCFFGFPAYGEAGTKAAQDVGGEEVTADSRTDESDPAIFRRLTDFLSRYLPTAVGPVMYTKTCLYTMPPDRHFVLDHLPGHPNILIALGAAHGFKFASLFGKILSELAVDGATRSPIAPFKFDRPLLKMENPPKNFMT